MKFGIDKFNPEPRGNPHRYGEDQANSSLTVRSVEDWVPRPSQCLVIADQCLILCHLLLRKQASIGNKGSEVLIQVRRYGEGDRVDLHYYRVAFGFILQPDRSPMRNEIPRSEDYREGDWPLGQVRQIEYSVVIRNAFAMKVQLVQRRNTITVDGKSLRSLSEWRNEN